MPILTRRVGARRVVATGFFLMALGTASLSLILPADVPSGVIALLMLMVGLPGHGRRRSPDTTSTAFRLTEPAPRSGVLNTSRQGGGALAVAPSSGPSLPPRLGSSPVRS